METYTDRNQGIELVGIVPIESADMYYKPFDNYPSFFGDEENSVGKRTLVGVPCWSLGALLNVLPSVIKRNGKRMFLTLEKAGAYNLYYKSPDRLDELWVTEEEPIDACVTMIENLQEIQIL